MASMWSEEGEYLTRLNEDGSDPQQKPKKSKSQGRTNPNLSSAVKWAAQNPQLAKYDNDGNPVTPDHWADK